VNTARRLAVWAAGAVAVGAFETNAGADSQPSVLVCGEGSQGQALASRIASQASASYRLADSPCKALYSGRGTSSLTAAASGRAADAKLVARARNALQSTHTDAAILVVARKSKHGAAAAAAVHVWLVDANGTGPAAVDQDVALEAGSSPDDAASAVWNVVVPSLPSRRPAHSEEASASAKHGGSQEPSERRPSDPSSGNASEPAATAEGGTAAGADQGPSDSTEPREGGRATALAFVRAAVEIGARNFTYVDRLTPTLRPYSLSAAPLAVVEGELYPLARSGAPVLKDLGVTLDYAMAFGLSSADSAGTSVGTSWNAFDAGLRERIPLGRSVLLGLHAGYGENAFQFRGALPTTAQLPGVRYRFVRGGADGRLALGSLALYACASYLDVLDAGPVGAYFPRATIGGLEGRFGVTRSMGRNVELSLEVAYTRFFYSLNPQPGDAHVAGGALDQMAFGSLGAAYVF
jgi:hypothetical protein